MKNPNDPIGSRIRDLPACTVLYYKLYNVELYKDEQEIERLRSDRKLLWPDVRHCCGVRKTTITSGYPVSGPRF